MKNYKSKLCLDCGTKTIGKNTRCASCKKTFMDKYQEVYREKTKDERKAKDKEYRERTDSLLNKEELKKEKGREESKM